MSIFTKEDNEKFRVLRITHIAQTFEALLADEENEQVEPETLFRQAADHSLQIRQSKTWDIHEFQSRWAVLGKSVKATKMVEMKSLFRTLAAWRRELLVFVKNRLTNARSEAANLTAKNLKRIGRG